MDKVRRSQLLGKTMGGRFVDAFGEQRTYSEETARSIDEEVRVIVETAQERALSLLRRKRPALEASPQPLHLTAHR